MAAPPFSRGPYPLDPAALEGRLEFRGAVPEMEEYVDGVKVPPDRQVQRTDSEGNPIWQVTTIEIVEDASTGRETDGRTFVWRTAGDAPDLSRGNVVSPVLPKISAFPNQNNPKVFHNALWADSFESA